MFLRLQPIDFLSVVYLNLFGDSVDNIFRLSQNFKEIFILSFSCLIVKLVVFKKWHGDSVLYLQTLIVGTRRATTEPVALTVIHTHTHSQRFVLVSQKSCRQFTVRHDSNQSSTVESVKNIKMGQYFSFFRSLACSHLYSKHC